MYNKFRESKITFNINNKPLQGIAPTRVLKTKSFLVPSILV